MGRGKIQINGNLLDFSLILNFLFFLGRKTAPSTSYQNMSEDPFRGRGGGGYL